MASMRQSYLAPQYGRASMLPGARPAGGVALNASAASGAGGSQLSNASQISAISSCIQSVSLSCAHLEETNAFVAHMTAPYERLAHVLQSKRHFDLVSESEIRKAREHLSAEIAPQLQELVEKAKESLEREERAMKALRNKTLQQQAQLDEMGIKLPSVDGAAAQDASARDAEAAAAQAAAAATKAAEREIELLKKQLATIKRKRDTYSRDVKRLEEDVERVGRLVA